MKIQITEPKEGAFTRHELPVRGICEGMPDGRDLWMVTFPETMQNFHPQGAPAVLREDGWRAMAYIGNSRPDADAGVRFELLAVAATHKATQAFRNYIAEAARRQQWLGLGELPPGAEVVHRITVIRDDEKAPPVNIVGAGGVSVGTIHAEGRSMVIISPGGSIHINPQPETVHAAEEPSDEVATAAVNRRLVVNMQTRKAHYCGVEVRSLPPRDLVCLYILAQHPGIALPLRTIYEKAAEEGVDADRFAPGAGNLPLPKAIRFAIRDAIHQALATEYGRSLTAQEEKEIQDLLDSRRDGTITLQIPKEDVWVVGLPRQAR